MSARIRRKQDKREVSRLFQIIFFIVLGDGRHSDLLSVKIQLRGLELYELCSYLSLSLLNTGLHPV